MKFTAITAVAILAATTVHAADDTFVWSTMGAIKNPIVSCAPVEIAKRIVEITGQEEEPHVGATAFANPRRQYSQIARGITDFSFGPMSYTPGRFPLHEILTLPFVAEDPKAASRALMELHSEFPALAAETEDIHLLAVFAAGPYQLHLRQARENVADLSGLRIRVTGTPLTNAVKNMGGEIASLPMPEAYENLSKGVVDGAMATNNSLNSFKLMEVADYHVQMNVSVPIMFTGLSKTFYDTLPADQQAAIDAEFRGADAAVRYTSCWDKPDQIAVNLASDRGNTFRDLTPEERDAMEAAAKPVIDAYLAELDGKGLPGTEVYNALKARAAELTN